MQTFKDEGLTHIHQNEASSCFWGRGVHRSAQTSESPLILQGGMCRICRTSPGSRKFVLTMHELSCMTKKKCSVSSFWVLGLENRSNYPNSNCVFLGRTAGVQFLLQSWALWFDFFVVYFSSLLLFFFFFFFPPTHWQIENWNNIHYNLWLKCTLKCCMR